MHENNLSKRKHILVISQLPSLEEDEQLQQREQCTEKKIKLKKKALIVFSLSITNLCLKDSTTLAFCFPSLFIAKHTPI